MVVLKTRMTPVFGGRIHDTYTGLPVGFVNHVPNPYGKGGAGFVAQSFFEGKIPEPDGGWGKRADLAAKAVWDAYNSELPCIERIKRGFWRINTYSLVISAAVSAAVSAVITVSIG